MLPKTKVVCTKQLNREIKSAFMQIEHFEITFLRLVINLTQKFREMAHLLNMLSVSPTFVKSNRLSMHKFKMYEFLIVFDYLLYFGVFPFIYLLGVLESIYVSSTNCTKLNKVFRYGFIMPTFAALASWWFPLACISFTLWLLLHYSKQTNV